jgi:hypothetical protein
MGKSLSDQRLVPTRGTICVTNSMKDEKIKNKNKIKMKKEPRKKRFFKFSGCFHR